MMERCGDRQRKFDGLEKWPFRFFIESLPIMLQIALLLLASGLSRYMWSVNTSVARIVISFTIFGILFYIGIVVAGTSSYECPFQTPASKQWDNPEPFRLARPRHQEEHPEIAVNTVPTQRHLAHLRRMD